MRQSERKKREAEKGRRAEIELSKKEMPIQKIHKSQKRSRTCDNGMISKANQINESFTLDKKSININENNNEENKYRATQICLSQNTSSQRLKHKELQRNELEQKSEARPQSAIGKSILPAYIKYNGTL